MESFEGYLSFKVIGETRKVVEQLADSLQMSLGAAARVLSERGIMAMSASGRTKAHV